MDGTITDLYGVNGWLDMLRSENATPYEQAQPLDDMARICELCELLQDRGYRIGVISWLSKEATKEYKKAVTKAKREWLERYLSIKLDEAHFVQYGTRKDYVAKDKQGILFDDDEKVREFWRGISVNPKEKNISEILESILENTF